MLPQANEGLLECDILTNPPFNKSLEFVKQALNIIEDGYNVVMFLRLQFLEGKTRKVFFENNPPKEILTVAYEPVTGSHVGPGTLALFFTGASDVRIK